MEMELLLQAQKQIENSFQLLTECIQAINQERQLTVFVSDGPPIASACLLYYDLQLALSVLHASYPSHDLLDSDKWPQQLHTLRSTLVILLLNKEFATQMQTYLDEKFVEYKVSLEKIKHMEMEEFWNVLNLRSAIEAVLYSLKWIKDTLEWQLKIEKMDAKLRMHGQKNLLSPLSRKEKLRLLKPESNWWYYSDFYD